MRDRDRDRERKLRLEFGLLTLSKTAFGCCFRCCSGGDIIFPGFLYGPRTIMALVMVLKECSIGGAFCKFVWK